MSGLAASTSLPTTMVGSSTAFIAVSKQAFVISLVIVVLRPSIEKLSIILIFCFCCIFLSVVIKKVNAEELNKQEVLELRKVMMERKRNLRKAVIS